MKINFSKKAWITFSVSLMASLIMGINAHAIDSSSPAAAKYGITFPIAELGNCSDVSDCKRYCEDPLNQDTCVNFAKKKGFYKENKTAVQNSISISAKQELGCDSKDACKTFCSEEENWQKCGEFAKKHNLSGGQTEDPTKKEILTKAKEVLGCSSYDECKGFCTREENKQRCDEFAKLVGLRGGVEKKGPGGCTTEETCKAFCSDPNNFQICQGYAKTYGGQFKGPGGCDSETVCQSYCQAHKDECANYLKDSKVSNSLDYDPQELCNKTPNCSFSKNSCNCKSTYSGPQGAPAYENADEHARFCREFPDKCTSTTTTNTTPPTYTAYPTYSSSPTTAPTSTPTPQATSSTSSGTDSSFCNGGDSNYFSKGSCTDALGTHTDYCDGSTVRSWYCTGTWNGTSWSNRHCEAGGYVCSSGGYTCSDGACVGGTTSTSAPTSTSTPVPTLTPAGNTDTGSSVKGINTLRSLFQRLLDFLK